MSKLLIMLITCLLPTTHVAHAMEQSGWMSQSQILCVLPTLLASSHFALSPEAVEVVNRILKARDPKSSSRVCFVSDIEITKALEEYKATGHLAERTLEKLALYCFEKCELLEAFVYLVTYEKISEKVLIDFITYLIKCKLWGKRQVVRGFTKTSQEIPISCEIIKCFIERIGCNINSFHKHNSEKNSFLHQAIKHSKLELTELLLTLGAHPNAFNKAAETPLDTAKTIFNRSDLSNSLISSSIREILTLLRKYKAKTGDELPYSRLFNCIKYGANTTLIESFLQEKIDLNKRINKEQDTLLAVAAHTGNLPIIEILLRHGARPNYRNTAGLDAINIAQRTGNTAVVERLTELLYQDFLSEAEFVSGENGPQSSTSTSSIQNQTKKEKREEWDELSSSLCSLIIQLQERRFKEFLDDSILVEIEKNDEHIATKQA